MSRTVTSEVDWHSASSPHLWTLLTAVSGINDERERARFIATGLPSLLSCRFSGIALVDQGDAAWTVVAQANKREVDESLSEQIRAELVPLFQQVSRRPVLEIGTDETGVDTPAMPESIQNLGIQSLMLVPVRTLRYRLGMIFAGRELATGFTKGEILGLSMLAGQFAVGLENLRLYASLEQDSERLRRLVEDRTQKLRRYTKRLEVLQEIDRGILAADSPRAIAQAALRHISELVPCLRASVGVFDYEARESVILAIKFRGKTKMAHGATFPLDVFDLERLRRGQVQSVEDTESSSDRFTDRRLRAEGVRSWFAVPLMAQGELIGVLNMGSDAARAFSDDDIDIGRQVADSLAIAIWQAQLLDRLHSQAADLEKRVAERTADLEAFSYSVSHDLRAPLRAIEGFSRVLHEDHGEDLDAECNRLLDVICTNTRNMGQLIDDLLAFSRLGRQEIRKAEIDMADLAQAVYEEIVQTVPEQSIRLNIGPMPRACADRSLIRQVLVNLLSNAVKFTRTRETSLIDIGYKSEDGENIYFVKDNGVGFDGRYADKLFGVFQRLHTSEEFEGTGVGLAIVHSIVQRHGGRVWGESTIDEGATVYFSLPCPEAKKW